VRGCAYLCTPQTNGLYQKHEFVGVIEFVDDSRPQIGRLHYIRLDVPIARWFGDGSIHIHSARYNLPLSIEPSSPQRATPAEPTHPPTLRPTPLLPGRAR
jgi:hypothetical protein